MSSKRTILGTLITIGTLTAGVSSLQAATYNDHDRPVKAYVIQQQAPDSSDSQVSVSNTFMKKPLSRDMEGYERQH